MKRLRDPVKRKTATFSNMKVFCITNMLLGIRTSRKIWLKFGKDCVMHLMNDTDSTTKTVETNTTSLLESIPKSELQECFKKVKHQWKLVVH